MLTRLGPPVCVLIMEIVLLEGLINILLEGLINILLEGLINILLEGLINILRGHLGVLIIKVVLIERCPSTLQVPLYPQSFQGGFVL